MNFIFRFWWAAFTFGWMPLYISNKKKSSSSTTTTTENQDNRIVTESGVAVGLNRSSGNNVSISVTDRGAVDSAFKFSREISKDAFASNTVAMNLVQDATEAAIEKVAAAYEDSSAGLEAAYETAKAGEQKMFGVAVLGIVAFAFTRLVKK